MGGMGGGMGGFGGGAGGAPEFNQMQQQLQQNPGMMRDMLNSPMMRGAMDEMSRNPEMLRQMINADPRMREVIEQNPELGHALNDPETLRRTFEVAANPNLMAEQMRLTDRSLANIEAHPEGFNALSRMHNDVSEPMMRAAEGRGVNTTNSTLSDPNNPFAAMFAANPVAGANTQTSNTAAGGNAGGTPDPWAPHVPGSNPAGVGNPGNPFASMFGGMGGGGGGGAPPPDPFPAVNSDVKFITCATCKALAKRLHSQISKWDAKVTGSEEALQAKVAEMCDPKSAVGSWITEYDMVESKDGKAVELKRQSSQGECEVECNTIALACKELLQESEIDLAAGIFKSFNGKKKKPLDVKTLTSQLCTSDDGWAANVKGGCASGVPKVPKKRTAGPPWKAKAAAPSMGAPGGADAGGPGMTIEPAKPDAPRIDPATLGEL